MTTSRTPPEIQILRNRPPEASASHLYRIEVFRKAIHLCSLSIPILYFHLPRSVALSILIPLTLAFTVVDVARHYVRPVERWFYQTWGWLLREHEIDQQRRRLNGATYVLIAATLVVVIFPKIIAVTSFAILIIADLSAALIGRRFGRHRFLGKSLEGSAAFFVSAVLVVLATPKVGNMPMEYLVGIGAAAIGTVVESLPLEIDDNLSVPLGVGFSLWAGYAFFLPHLNVYHFG